MAGMLEVCLLSPDALSVDTGIGPNISSSFSKVNGSEEVAQTHDKCIFACMYAAKFTSCLAQGLLIREGLKKRSTVGAEVALCEVIEFHDPRCWSQS